MTEEKTADEYERSEEEGTLEIGQERNGDYFNEPASEIRAEIDGHEVREKDGLLK